MSAKRCANLRSSIVLSPLQQSSANSPNTGCSSARGMVSQEEQKRAQDMPWPWRSWRLRNDGGTSVSEDAIMQRCVRNSSLAAFTGWTSAVGLGIAAGFRGLIRLGEKMASLTVRRSHLNNYPNLRCEHLKWHVLQSFRYGLRFIEKITSSTGSKNLLKIMRQV